MIEVNPGKVSNADLIRDMSDSELNDFLYRFKITAIKRFLEGEPGDSSCLMSRSKQKFFLTGSDKVAPKGSEFDTEWLDDFL